jgi:enoyl-CoA hydratase/carnithine racemase
MFQTANGVVRITLNNPAKRNALSFQVLDDLESALKNVCYMLMVRFTTVHRVALVFRIAAATNQRFYLFGV